MTHLHARHGWSRIARVYVSTHLCFCVSLTKSVEPETVDMSYYLFVLVYVWRHSAAHSRLSFVILICASYMHEIVIVSFWKKMSFVGLDCLPWTLNIRFLVLCPSRDRSPWFAVTSSIYLTPVAELFLQLSFEKIFKTQWIFKIEERFQVMLEWFKYSCEKGKNLLGSKNPWNFQKSRDFLRALSGGFTFHGSFSKKAVQI